MRKEIKELKGRLNETETSKLVMKRIFQNLNIDYILFLFDLSVPTTTAKS